MSVNLFKDGELINIAAGSRVWIGTKEAHAQAVAAGTMPNNCIVCITDDNTEAADVVEAGNMNPVTSNAVYAALGAGKIKTRYIGPSYAGTGFSWTLDLKNLNIAVPQYGCVKITLKSYGTLSHFCVLFSNLEADTLEKTFELDPMASHIVYTATWEGNTLTSITFTGTTAVNTINALVEVF